MENFAVPTFAILDPKGLVALGEKNWIVFALLLMFGVAIGVFILLFTVVLKYRSPKSDAESTPDRDSNRWVMVSWWAIPAVVVLILAPLTWIKSHELDPFKPITSNQKPVTIQVVALQWKWLFIYPEQNIATVNYVQFPANTPINFELTADAPMNSFWIPQLGGQMYAMTGMGTKLHLIANEPGEYAGSTAEISGAGFAGMRFMAKATSTTDFESWVQSVKKFPAALDMAEYHNLATPSEDTPVTFYSSAEEDLYNKVMAKYMPPTEKMTKSKYQMSNEFLMSK
jgi:cytochrome o ubiquinol oxidase subunit II